MGPKHAPVKIGKKRSLSGTLLAEEEARSRSRTPRTLNRSPTCDEQKTTSVGETNKMRVVSGKALGENQGLERLAQEHLQSFASLLGTVAKSAPNRVITVGTACTGSAADIFVFAAAEKALRDTFPHIRFQFLFNCEINEKKRKWIQKLHKSCSDTDKQQPCLFGNIMDLGNEEATCYVHGRKKKCKIPSVDILLCCTSCKEFSLYYNKPQKPVNDKANSSTSAQTFAGLLAYMSAYRPGILLFENVDTMDSVQVGDNNIEFNNMDLACAEWAARGYETQRCHVNSINFGVPQNRRRLVVVAVLTVANPSVCFQEREVSVVFATLRALLKTCARTSECLKQFLLPHDSVEVTQELDKRAQVGTKMTTYNMAAASRTSASLVVSWNTVCNVPEHLKQSDWFATLTPEQRDVLSFSVHFQGESVMLRDCSQSVGRTRVSVFDEGTEKHIAPTVTPGQLMMLFDEDETPRLLLGREALWLQGFPILEKSVAPVLEGESESFLTDLAGNMVSTPVLLALVLSTMSALSWRQEGTPVTTVDCRALAESALALCNSRSTKTKEPKNKGIFRVLRDLEKR